MFVQQLNGDFDEMLDERTGKKPKKFTVSKDTRGNKRMNVPLVLMDQGDDPARSIEAIKDAAWKAMVERTCSAWKSPMHVPGGAPAAQPSRDDGIENYATGRDGYIERTANAWKWR